MRKTIFDLKVWTEDGPKDAPISGWVNDQFGVHKCTESKKYVITHLRTGLALPGRFIFQKHARDLAERLDQAVFPAEFGGDQQDKNIPKIREIFRAMELGWGHIDVDNDRQFYRN